MSSSAQKSAITSDTQRYIGRKIIIVDYFYCVGATIAMLYYEFVEFLFEHENNAFISKKIDKRP